MKTSNAIQRLGLFFQRPFIEKCFYFLMAFIFVFVQSDAFLFSLGGKFRILQIALISLWGLVLFLRLFFINGQIGFLNSKEYKIIVIPIAIVLVSCLVNISNTMNIHRNIFIVLHLIISPFIFESFDIKKLFKYFLVVLIGFCIVSDIFFLVDRLKPDIFSSVLPTITNKAGLNFSWYFLGFVQIHDYDGSGFRNFGPFREPGVFGLFIILALIVFLNKEYRFKNIWINLICLLALVATLITTLSTTALFALIIVGIAFLFRDINFKKPITYIKITIVLLVIATILILGIIDPPFIKESPILDAMFSKFFNAKSYSFYSRLFDNVASLACVIRNPLFGNGWGVHHDMMVELSIAFDQTTNGGINSFFTFASVYGTIFGYFVIKYWYLSCYRLCEKKIVMTVLTFLAVFFVLANEDFTNNLLFIFIPYSTMILSLDEKRAIIRDGELVLENIK